MPNYCANCLYVYGDRIDRDEFLTKTLKKCTRNHDLCECDGLDFDLNTIVPLQKDDEPSIVWGTKWNCCDTRTEKGVEFDKIYFRTAWSPYLQGVQKKMNEQFPTLKFELLFAECGRDFQGYYKSSFDEFTNTVVLVENVQKCDPVSGYCDCVDSDDEPVDYCDDHPDYLLDPKYSELYQNSG